MTFAIASKTEYLVTSPDGYTEFHREIHPDLIKSCCLLQDTYTNLKPFTGAYIRLIRLNQFYIVYIYTVCQYFKKSVYNMRIYIQSPLHVDRIQKISK